MNKIECKIQSNLFEDFPVGTIFLYGGDFYIKINQNEIWDGLSPEDESNIDVKIDKYSVPNAVCLSDGKAAYFSSQNKINMTYPNATLSIG